MWESEFYVPLKWAILDEGEKLLTPGKIKQFTGVSDPFEEPKKCTIEIDGSDSIEIKDNIEKIISQLKKEGYLN